MVALCRFAKGRTTVIYLLEIEVAFGFIQLAKYHPFFSDRHKLRPTPIVAKNSLGLNSKLLLSAAAAFIVAG